MNMIPQILVAAATIIDGVLNLISVIKKDD